MAPKQAAERVPVKTPDPAKLADAWTSVLVNGAEAIRAATERSMVAPAAAPYDPLAPSGQNFGPEALAVHRGK